MEDFKEFDLQHAVETYKSLITISTTVFKYLFLLNGGAAVAMMTGLDKIAAVVKVSSIRWSMCFFVIGLVIAGVATFFAYFTQASLHEENMRRQRHGSYKKVWMACVGCCIVSLSAFCVGALIAVFGMWY